MMQPPDVPQTFRFGDFELDVAGYSLRRGGQPVRLERRPMDLLILLVQRRRELVSRNDIVERLWGTDCSSTWTWASTPPSGRSGRSRRRSGDTGVRRNRVRQGVSLHRRSRSGPTGGRSFCVECRTLAVLPFENLGGTPEHDYLADGFTEEATTALGQIDPEHLSVIGRTAVMGYERTTKSLAKSVASSAPRM